MKVLTLVAPLILLGCAPKAPTVPGPLHALRREPAPVSPEAGTSRAERRKPQRASSFGEAVARSAEFYLEHRPPREFRDDCSGFVMAVFDRAGAEISGSAAMFHDLARERGMLHHRRLPAVGDLAFFDDTYDRNDNGKVDDPLSHVAVVLSVEPDGTILLAHGGTSRGRTTLRMNLRAAEVHETESGEVLNDWLRRRTDQDPERTRYLAGELWSAFATFDPRRLADDEATEVADASGIR